MRVSDEPQTGKFKQAAREPGCDDDEARRDAVAEGGEAAVTDRAFKIGVGSLVTVGAVIAMLLGWEAWFAPVMECLGTWANG